MHTGLERLCTGHYCYTNIHVKIELLCVLSSLRYPLCTQISGACRESTTLAID